MLTASALLLRGAPGSGGPAAGPARFGPGTETRVAALRDRLAAGLLDLREPGGGFVPRTHDPTIEPVHEAEATAFGLLGLAAARRLGASDPRIPPAIDAARAWLRSKQQPDGGFGGTMQGGRTMGILAVGTAILAWVLVGDPADEDVLDRAAGRLAHEVSLGKLPDGWPRGVATLATTALIGAGRAGALGDDPILTVQIREPPGPVRDSRDPRVAEALARVIRALGALRDSYPVEILEKCIELRSEWGGERTDLSSWCLRAWLASRLEGGDRWFSAILPELEKAPAADGKIEGDLYGYPASRNACALLILLEGTGLRPAFGGP